MGEKFKPTGGSACPRRKRRPCVETANRHRISRLPDPTKRSQISKVRKIKDATHRANVLAICGLWGHNSAISGWAIDQYHKTGRVLSDAEVIQAVDNGKVGKWAHKHHKLTKGVVLPKKKKKRRRKIRPEWRKKGEKFRAEMAKHKVVSEATRAEIELREKLESLGIPL